MEKHGSNSSTTALTYAETPEASPDSDSHSLNEISSRRRLSTPSRRHMHHSSSSSMNDLTESAKSRRSKFLDRQSFLERQTSDRFCIMNLLDPIAFQAEDVTDESSSISVSMPDESQGTESTLPSSFHESVAGMHDSSNAFPSVFQRRDEEEDDLLVEVNRVLSTLPAHTPANTFQDDSCTVPDESGRSSTGKKKKSSKSKKEKKSRKKKEKKKDKNAVDMTPIEEISSNERVTEESITSDIPKEPRIVRDLDLEDLLDRPKLERIDDTISSVAELSIKPEALVNFKDDDGLNMETESLNAKETKRHRRKSASRSRSERDASSSRRLRQQIVSTSTEERASSVQGDHRSSEVQGEDRSSSRKRSSRKKERSSSTKKERSSSIKKERSSRRSSKKGSRESSKRGNGSSESVSGNVETLVESEGKSNTWNLPAALATSSPIARAALVQVKMEKVTEFGSDADFFYIDNESENEEQSFVLGASSVVSSSTRTSKKSAKQKGSFAWDTSTIDDSTSRLEDDSFRIEDLVHSSKEQPSSSSFDQSAPLSSRVENYIASTQPSNGKKVRGRPPRPHRSNQDSSSIASFTTSASTPSVATAPTALHHGRPLHASHDSGGSAYPSSSTSVASSCSTATGMSRSMANSSMTGLSKSRTDTLPLGLSRSYPEVLGTSSRSSGSSDRKSFKSAMKASSKSSQSATSMSSSQQPQPLWSKNDMYTGASIGKQRSASAPRMRRAASAPRGGQSSPVSPASSVPSSPQTPGRPKFRLGATLLGRARARYQGERHKKFSDDL